MTADVKLLRERLQDYADGLGAPPILLHDVGELVALLREADAEIEALRAEVLRLRTDNSESFRDAAILANIRRDEAEARAERLAEALRVIEGFTMSQFPDAADMAGACVETAHNALHPTAAQENDDA